MVARRALACPVCVCVCRLDAGNEGGGTLLRTTRCHGDREQEAARRNGAPQKGAAAGGEKKTPKSPKKKDKKKQMPATSSAPSFSSRRSLSLVVFLFSFRFFVLSRKQVTGRHHHAIKTR